ncbi:MAG: hypothetical protein PVI01_11005 [Gemmatimonadales bacterium]|jgi:saccharopine dehydrogenase (NAD+, L-lysine-forming)
MANVYKATGERAIECYRRVLEKEIAAPVAGHEELCWPVAPNDALDPKTTLLVHVAAAMATEEAGSSRVSSGCVDAAKHEQVVTAFQGVDWVVICMPLTGLGDAMARAALEARVHHIDINGNDEKRAYLQEVAGDLQGEGLCFVSEAGLMPGLPSLMVRYAHTSLGELRTAVVGTFYRDRRVTPGSARDMLVELGGKHRVFESGAWRRTKLTESREVDFGEPLGKKRCYPFEVHELTQHPEALGLRDLGLYAAGYSPLVDMILTLWLVGGLYRYKAGIRLGAKLLVWAGSYARPPFTTLIQLDAVSHAGKSLRVWTAHEDA